MFHTTGMAERTFGASDQDNLRSKLYVYRKTQQNWSITLIYRCLLQAGTLSDGDGRTMMSESHEEFDPERTILLDYTADKNDKVTYRDWNVYKEFPWIFGIFHSLEKNSDIHEDYNILIPRLKEVVDDPKCLGLVMWSETRIPIPICWNTLLITAGVRRDLRQLSQRNDFVKHVIHLRSGMR